ncbi:MAG: hypothetical protein R3Y56_10075 [Akkermansia sp.]
MKWRNLSSALLALLGVSLLTQCNTMRSDCEAIALRNQEIAQEPAGDYYIGRRYYIPSTRFWGYIRRPGQSWSSAKLVIMDESTILTPDRGPEPPAPNATFGTDHNVEYYILGDFVRTPNHDIAYEPNSDQVLPVFRARSYTLRSSKPGFLFKPSERYNRTMVSLFPSMMPTAANCAAAQ